MTIDFLGNEGTRRQQPSVKPTPASSPEPLRGQVSSAERLTQRAVFKAAHDYALHSLCRLSIPKSDRADLVQEALLAASLRLSDYRPERGAPATWLRGFVVRVACNYQRKQRRYQRLLREESTREPVRAPSTDEGTSASAEHRRILLEELLPKVPLPQRVVVIAHDLDGLSMQVIAEQQEIPISTAYDRHKRGLAALERAHRRWLHGQQSRGLFLVPLGLGKLLDADRSIPEAPHEVLDAALQRFRRARPLSALRALLRRPALRSALTLVSGAVIGAGLHAALSKPAPASLSIASAPPALVAAAEAAPPVATVGAAPSATVAAVVSSTASPPRIRALAAAPSAVASIATADATLRVERPGDEDHVFDAARRAFDRGDLSTALAALQIHERDFPAGTFAFDRELLWIKALVRAGRTAEARARLDRLRESPGGRRLAERLDPFVPRGASSAAPAR